MRRGVDYIALSKLTAKRPYLQINCDTDSIKTYFSFTSQTEWTLSHNSNSKAGESNRAD